MIKDEQEAARDCAQGIHCFHKTAETMAEEYIRCCYCPYLERRTK